MTRHDNRALCLLFACGLTGCGLFIHGKTPIGGIPEGDREQVEAGLNEPDQIRLTKPTKIAGVELAAGSMVKRDGETNYRLVSAAETSVSGVTVPAGTEIELVKANSIITGDKYNWNGVVHVGAEATYGGHAVAPGDRVVFAGNLLSAPSIMQIRLAERRSVNGKEYPAGTLIDIDANGKITGAYTPEAQRMLGQVREQRRKERAQREQDCKLRCAGVTDIHAHARCMGQCR